MVSEVLFALWFFLPAGAANMMPILVCRLPLLKRWNTPMDLGHSYRGKRVLGDSKTWRGLLCGSLTGLVVFAIQQDLIVHLGNLRGYSEIYDYDNLPLITGALLGFGALLGDAVKSFFKRQRGVPPSHSWFPFDQLDYIVGASILVAPVIVLSLKMYLFIAVIWFAMHLLFSYLGYLLRLKKTPI